MLLQEQAIRYSLKPTLNLYHPLLHHNNFLLDCLVRLDLKQPLDIHVNRINFDNGLSKEAQSHLSEHALDNFNFDFKLINNGDKTYLKVIDSILGDINDIVNNR